MARIAIIGAGIAGLSAAHHLHGAGGGRHELTIYEAGAHPGGHTATVDVTVGGRRHAIDTGFIVFNERTYPRFCALLAHLGVASKPTSMSFGVRDDVTGLAYASSGLSSWFAQRRTLLRPRHWRMLAEVVRFGRAGRGLLAIADDTTTLDELLTRHRFSETFRRQFIVPMGAAIWSTPPGELGGFPARTFVEFFANHGFLEVIGAPVWRVIVGGSRAYVAPLIRPFADRLRLRTPVERIWRRGDAVEIAAAGATERHDHVIVACHSDQALRLLGDATAAERAVLGAIRYQPNDVVLHTDTSLLPAQRRAWAAWNYHITGDAGRPATLTYDMNRLQGIDSPVRFCVTLNETASIDPARILGRYRYDHPVHDAAARAAQARWDEVSGRGSRTQFAGAYWFYGFHEDGVRSGFRAAEAVLAAERAPAATDPCLVPPIARRGAHR
jgi:predicted NAD/FAD-binding protein